MSEKLDKLFNDFNADMELKFNAIDEMMKNIKIKYKGIEEFMQDETRRHNKVVNAIKELNNDLGEI